MAFEKTHEETIYHGRVFDLVRASYRLPNENEHVYDMVKHPGAVTIVPVDQDGRIWFVRQFRIGAGQSLLELPAGVLEEGEAAEVAAAREVQEEVGLAAGHLKKLGEFYMVPGYSTEKLTAYLATDLHESFLPSDEDEFLEREAIRVQQVFEMILHGQILDGKTLAALLLARPYLSQLAGVKAI